MSECLFPKCKAIDNCQLPVDIILQSSDGETLGAHTRNLEVFNDAFPSPESVSHSATDVITLTENAEILLLLLKFSHNCTLPDISCLSFETTRALYEGADKYGNQIAAQACKSALRKHFESLSPEACLDHLVYKLSKNDVDDIDAVIRRTMTLPLVQVLCKLKEEPLSGTDALLTYALYRDQWRDSATKYRDTINSKMVLLDREEQIILDRLKVEEMILTEWDFSAFTEGVIRIRPRMKNSNRSMAMLQSLGFVVKSYPTWLQMEDLRRGQEARRV
ncbi:hypothetical protein WG66_005380 [Moniliophthora roreri]|nr:hypothetical protein WG66_005380 [Moniliophthora roreri]